MFYQLREVSHTLFDPMIDLADAYSKFFTNPLCPVSHMSFARPAAAGYELMYRLGKTYEKPPFGIRSTVVNGRRVGLTEEILQERPFCKLLHFRKNVSSNERARLVQPAVLLVAPLSGHHATLLRDTVSELLKEHDVFLTDWTDARLVPLASGSFGLNDYIRYVQDFIRQLGPDLHVIAICQSTVPVLAAVALMASEDDAGLPKSMTMMGGPIDPRKSPTQVNRLAIENPLSWFKNTMIDTVPSGHPGAGRKVYPGFIQHASFVAMNAWRHLQSHVDFYGRRCRGESAEAYCEFYDEYNAVLDMPEEFYLDTIRTAFQDCSLALGRWQVEGKTVRPQDIKTVALFTIEGERDDICGPGQTEAAHTLCCAIPTWKKQHFSAPDCGHYGIFSGLRWRDMICPRIGQFIRANAGGPAASRLTSKEVEECVGHM